MTLPRTIWIGGSLSLLFLGAALISFLWTPFDVTELAVANKLAEAGLELREDKLVSRTLLIRQAEQFGGAFDHAHVQIARDVTGVFKTLQTFPAGARRQVDGFRQRTFCHAPVCLQFPQDVKIITI